MGEALSHMVDSHPHRAAPVHSSCALVERPAGGEEEETGGRTPSAKLMRRMPSVKSVLGIPGRDLRTDIERGQNVAERGHIIGLEVASALMRATAAGSAEEPALRELASLSMSGPDNYVITSHALNMRYFKGEQELVSYIDDYARLGRGDARLKTEAARYVSHFIMEMHTNRLKPFLRCVGRERTGEMVDILQSVLG